MKNKVKSNRKPKQTGFGVRKRGKLSSVDQVNRMRARNKKTLKQVVAELDALG